MRGTFEAWVTYTDTGGARREHVASVSNPRNVADVWTARNPLYFDFDVRYRDMMPGSPVEMTILRDSEMDKTQRVHTFTYEGEKEADADAPGEDVGISADDSNAYPDCLQK
ncbi:hypothetical protein PG994_014442 [Apiospora phragmitis]|uniref:Uncharacterized protein n=1 Tax=Apiospora phragmitis TaxID=2905665 RepID=A0ABR1T631_9PEZI